MSTPERTEAERAHANLAGFYRWLPRLDPGATLLDEGDGVVAFAGTRDWPSDRLALRNSDALGPDAWIERADGFLRARGECACVFARVDDDDDLTERLTDRGYFEYGLTPEMVCWEALADRATDRRVTVRLATDAGDIAAYAAIAGQAFTDLGMREDMVRGLVDNPEALLRPECAVSIGELDGEPVAGALSVLVGDEPHGYVGWVSCLKEARGFQLGDAVTRLVTNEAFARGAGMVSLEASPFGESTYRHMGYEELYRYRLLIRLG